MHGSGAREILNICVLEEVTGPSRDQWEATGGNGMPQKSSDEICIEEYRTHGLFFSGNFRLYIYILVKVMVSLLFWESKGSPDGYISTCVFEIVKIRMS